MVNFWATPDSQRYKLKPYKIPAWREMIKKNLAEELLAIDSCCDSEYQSSLRLWSLVFWPCSRGKNIWTTQIELDELENKEQKAGWIGRYCLIQLFLWRCNTHVIHPRERTHARPKYSATNIQFDEQRVLSELCTREYGWGFTYMSRNDSKDSYITKAHLITCESSQKTGTWSILHSLQAAQHVRDCPFQGPQLV